MNFEINIDEQMKSVTKNLDKTRAWQRMLSGRRLDLLEPSPLDIEIEDIAHGLARVARWNGQTKGEHAYSVAQHSILVLDIQLLLEPELDKANMSKANFAKAAIAEATLAELNPPKLYLLKPNVPELNCQSQVC